MKGGPVLTNAEMRALEASYADTHEDGLWTLMKRAGEGAAKTVAVRAAGREVLVLCGPGNNGGDGYVIAATLRDMGVPVRVAALASPASELCRRAAAGWTGQVAGVDCEPVDVFVDCGFGTGLSRPVESDWIGSIARLAGAAAWKFALDVPSGVYADTGEVQEGVPCFDETLVPAALKPAHLLYPAARSMGRLTLIDIGLPQADVHLHENTLSDAATSDPAGHKFDRGHVAVIFGDMAGAGWLASRAAQRGGAGFVSAVGGAGHVPPSSIVARAAEWDGFEKVDAIVIGPGLGTDRSAKSRTEGILKMPDMPKVLDGDMFTLFADEPQRLAGDMHVLTPHEGEFMRMFGEMDGSKVERVRSAARQAGAVVVLKGADTVIAHPDGRAAINAHASPRLATAGSGDVLAGVIGAELASGRDAFAAACAGVWRHGDAGLRGRDGLIAEDLLDLL